MLRSGSQEGVSVSRWKRRWTIVALCFVAFMLCNMDRVNMSIAVLPMSQQYGWDSQTIGLVQSSFFWCGPLRPSTCTQMLASGAHRKRIL